jgi:hypothetical protein
MCDSLKQPGQAGTEKDITPAMIAAGVDCFWDMAEDRFAVTYDAGSFATKLFTRMMEAKSGKGCKE